MPDHNNERILIVMTEHPIQGMMDTTLERIREMVDASTVIGDPIVTGDTTIIPVSKISYGFASGGSDFPTKQEKDCFGGGGGAGVSVTPVAFLVISGAGVQLLHVDANRSSMAGVSRSSPAIPPTYKTPGCSMDAPMVITGIRRPNTLVPREAIRTVGYRKLSASR